jgi:hypothetical protein
MYFVFGSLEIGWDRCCICTCEHHELGVGDGDTKRKVLLRVWILLPSNCVFPSLQALKGSKKLVLSVYSAGRIPGGYVTNHIYTWVDPQGRSTSPPSSLPQPHGSTLRQREDDRRSTLHLLQSGDEKKVRLTLNG